MAPLDPEARTSQSCPPLESTRTKGEIVLGYFEVGILHGKTPDNVGTLWRSAYQLGAAGIFTIGMRYPKRQACDTTKTYRHVPYRRWDTLGDYVIPYDCVLVGVEMGGESLPRFEHPERCVYLLGAEDHGLTNDALDKCHRVVSIPSIRTESYNVAMAGTIVMYDRILKRIGG